jgi:hypothetical protein
MTAFFQFIFKMMSGDKPSCLGYLRKGGWSSNLPYVNSQDNPIVERYHRNFKHECQLIEKPLDLNSTKDVNREQRAMLKDSIILPWTKRMN